MVVKAAAELESKVSLMRALTLLVPALALAACTQPVPDSGKSVGFESYNEYLRNREAQLNTGASSIVPSQPVFSTERIGAAIDAADAPATAVAPTGPQTGAIIGQTAPVQPGAPLTATRPRGDAPAGIRQESGEMAAVRGGGISDEQDFQAVSSRETIQSDAERLAQARAQYQVVQPTALPPRSGTAGPNIVEYALSTTNMPGQKLYDRGIFAGSGNACARYTSPDLAQEAFLKSGGPKRDPKGLDPDGDGFACSWDPRPFRAALR